MNGKKNLNIFLVDDNPLCTAIYHQHLVNSGIIFVSTFDDGEKCINALNDDPDIVFLDQHLIRETGIDVLKKIKHINHNIYVVMVSADDNEEVTNSALHFGAFDYIVKGGKELNHMDTTIDKILLTQQVLAR